MLPAITQNIEMNFDANCQKNDVSTTQQHELLDKMMWAPLNSMSSRIK